MMRKELFWDRQSISPKTEIERAINFGGFDFIDYVIEKYGKKQFITILLTSRNLSRKAVNYWCRLFEIDRERTKTFQARTIWSPFR